MMIPKAVIRCALVLLVVALAGMPLQAQTRPSRFDIPFPFLAGGQQMPAGQYYVAVDAFHRVVLRCHQPVCGTAVLAAYDTDGASKAAPPKGTLQFARSGEIYVLRRVRVANRPQFSELVQSKRELEALAVHPDDVQASVGTP
jgi:hypothetical protein